MADKLKPRPFCGGPATIERVGTARQSNIVTCTYCGCRVESGDVFDPTAAWNRRALVDGPAEGGQTDTRDAVEWDKHGTLRWRRNPLVDALYEHSKKHGIGLNELVDMQVGDARDWRELAKLIGYSLSGYCELSYVCDDDDEVAHVEAVADAAMSAARPAEGGENG